MRSAINTMLMPVWWQRAVLILLTLSQALFLAPVVLFFMESVILTEAAALMLVVVAFQYVLVFLISRIEAACTKSTRENLEQRAELDEDNE